MQGPLGDVLPYAIGVGVISLFMSSFYLISFCGGTLIGYLGECCGINLFPILSFISLVWWIVATCIPSILLLWVSAMVGWAAGAL
jgi:hypothetical protein